jgi:hypothetical protein
MQLSLWRIFCDVWFKLNRSHPVAIIASLKPMALPATNGTARVLIDEPAGLNDTPLTISD